MSISPLPWTGERYVPELRGTVALEHLHRYAYACQFVKNKVVLDIACGEGYGSEMLAKTAQRVFGVDVDNATVSHAKSKYGAKNLTFVEGSCEAIPIESKSVDVVVSFETIEHTENHDLMMSEIKRVLRPAGLLIISSPDKKTYGASRREHNPFHVRELAREEFKQLLEKYFRHRHIFGQSALHGSVIADEEGPSSFAARFSYDRLPGHTSPSSGLADPIYLLGLCSDQVLPPCAASFCEQPVRETEEFQQLTHASLAERARFESLVTERTEWARNLEAELGRLREAFARERQLVTERTEWAKKLESEVAVAIERAVREKERAETLGKEIAAVGESLANEQQLVAERTAWAQSLEKDVESARRAHEVARAEAADLRAQLQAMLVSTCWKLTAPLRWSVLSTRRLVERVRRLPKTTKLLLIDRHSGFFDAAWYLQQYPDVRDSRERPFLHYAFHGVFEGRMPSASRKHCVPSIPSGGRNWSAFSEYLDLVRTRTVSLRRVKKAAHTAFRLLRTQGLAGLRRGIETARLLQPRKICSAGSLQIEAPQAGCELPRPQLPHFSEPVVSVVIAVYNNVKYTASCIDSIAKSGIRAPYEVIVADDGSIDETAEWCRSITHLRHVVTGSQQGFVLNNNAGAAVAKGKYLLFLNNDTVVHEGWLDALMECAVKPGVGAVGAKLVYPDGTLQEAGGVIWRDFEGWNYGRNQNPMAPEFNFRRPVDYCSAACLLVAKDIFEKLGGFSKDLVPAYGEDSDLCFSIRHHLGLDVLYEPRACVTHFEGKSCGVSLQKGVKKYQTINQRKLAKKWRHITDKFPEASNANSLLGPRKFCGSPVVLIIDDYIPLHDRESGSRRLMSIIEIFQELGCHVMFLPCNLYGVEPYARNLRDKGVELLVCAEGYGVTPEELAGSRAPIVDIVWCVRPDITERWLSFFRTHNPGSLVLFDTGDIHHVRLRREEELLGKYIPGRSLSDEMKTREINLCRSADRTIAISRQDAAVWAEFGAEETKISVISGIYEDRTQSSDPDFESRSGLLFIGSYQHPPNADGAVWFLREIWPMIKKNAPRMTISFLGPNPPSNLRQRASEDVQVAGYVPCVDEFFGKARLFICPLRYGAGIKGKLGQCLEYKLPFVTTTIGAEGMNFRHGFDALIADNPETFANEVLRAYNDEQLWLKLRAGLQDHLQHYSVEAARREIKHIVQARKTPAGKI